MESRELAKAVACQEVWRDSSSPDGREQGRTRSCYRRLGPAGAAEGFVRVMRRAYGPCPFPQRTRPLWVPRLPDLATKGEVLGQLHTHVEILAPLPGKEKGHLGRLPSRPPSMGV